MKAFQNTGGCLIFNVLAQLLVYLLLMPIAYYINQIPYLTINTQSEYFRAFYYRVYQNTTFLNLNNLIYMNIAMNVGWFQVRFVTMLNFRAPLKVNRGYLSFFKLQLYSIVVYFLSGIITLRGKEDLYSTCASMEHDPGMCKEYSNQEVFFHNYFVWTPAFILGYHVKQCYLYFDSFWDFLRASEYWPWWMYPLEYLLIGSGVLVGVLLFIKYWFSGLFVFFYYLCLGGAAFLSQFIPYLVLLGDADYHFHHYYYGFLISAFMGYPDVITTIGQALGLGFVVEAGSIYGYDRKYDYYNPFKLSIQEKITYFFHKQEIDQETLYQVDLITTDVMDDQTWFVGYDKYSIWQKKLITKIYDWTADSENEMY